MRAAPYVMGIDLGTTTCRCAIFDLYGFEIASAYRETQVRYPRPLWAEVDPESWWSSTVAVVREALDRSGLTSTQIAGVGLSGLMHAPVLLDGEGQPLVPAMLWMDQRCAPQCETMGREQLALGASKTTTPCFSPMQTAPKLRWLADTQPELLARARELLLPKDFVRYRLTGAICTDPTDASGTGLFDHGRGEWDWAAVQLTHMPEDILPPIRPSWALAGHITLDAARATGLAPGMVVAVGGGDTSCTLTGAGALAAGEVCIYLGTAAWIALMDGAAQDGRPSVRSFSATATTGAALRWVRDLLAGTARAGEADSYDTLTRQAADVTPGAEGLFFLPHLMGERGPQADPLARGALIGLTLRHSRPQIVRAILEGTAFHLRRLLEAQASDHQLADSPEAGVACGGAARSPLWMQLLADITHMALRVPAVVEAGVLGAAILGGVAAGILQRDTARPQMAHIGPTYTPNAALVRRYNALYDRYCQLDDMLAPWFRASGLDEE
jgi:xylulokinase